MKQRRKAVGLMDLSRAVPCIRATVCPPCCASAFVPCLSSLDPGPDGNRRRGVRGVGRFCGWRRVVEKCSGKRDKSMSRCGTQRWLQSCPIARHF
ncbi:hypothetical protein GQ607_002971 [Colletotrichum asianum]|uniref:Uncharacterized protein n=1 Tax=Colletotrichum asianum TaxID=702518 RepID=A0A8H3ZS54_9PEZI|nr:hypothetical protein GQ607_002971 [Colletotrichum asianum]